MSDFDTLLERVHEFHKRHDRWPQVLVSWNFWNEYADQFAKLHEEGIDIQVVDDLKEEGSFILNIPDDWHPTIETVYDLKKQVDKLVEEGKGRWPVKYLPHDARVYLRIKLCPILPGTAPTEGLQLQPEHPGAPEGEHVLVLVGE